MSTISTAELEKFARKFGKMLGSGIPLIVSLELIEKESESSSIGKIAEKLVAKIKEGFTLSSSMKLFPGVFGDVFVAMVKAAENQGNLDGGLVEIADNLAEGIIEAGSGEAEFEEEAVLEKDVHNKVISRVNSLISQTFKTKCSLLQFKPEADRVDISLGDSGNLQLQESISKDEYDRVVARIKLMSCLDISERQLPQDGRILVKIGGETVDIKVQTLPTVFGELVMMSFINKKDAVVDPDKVFPDSEDRGRIDSLLANLNSGLVVFSGPSGSGKTTTMQSAAAMINDGSKTIVSVENQVYYTFAGISHIKTKPRIGLTLATATRSAIRAEPYLLIVEGLEDKETAKEVFQAAGNGTLVFTQMNARNPVDVFKQFNNLKVSSHLLYGGMGAVVFQVLVRKLCPDCRKKIQVSADELEKMNLGGLSAGSYFETTGCETCNHSGYVGRIPVYEFIVPDKNLRDIIIKGDPGEIGEAVEKIQNDSFSRKLFKLAAEGKTSLFEVGRIRGILDPSKG
jgi:general secretion pathway protein E